MGPVRIGELADAKHTDAILSEPGLGSGSACHGPVA